MMENNDGNREQAKNCIFFPKKENFRDASHSVQSPQFSCVITAKKRRQINPILTALHHPRNKLNFINQLWKKCGVKSSELSRLDYAAATEVNQRLSPLFTEVSKYSFIRLDFLGRKFLWETTTLPSKRQKRGVQSAIPAGPKGGRFK